MCLPGLHPFSWGSDDDLCNAELVISWPSSLERRWKVSVCACACVCVHLCLCPLSGVSLHHHLTCAPHHSGDYRYIAMVTAQMTLVACICKAVWTQRVCSCVLPVIVCKNVSGALLTLHVCARFSSLFLVTTGFMSTAVRNMRATYNGYIHH